MIPARQSTALELAIGPILDADGVAVTDGVVGDFKIKKTTGNFAALNGSATLTHVSAGFYDLVLTTSDTDTVGLCCVAIDDTTNACAPVYLQVIEEAIYDAFYAASATGLLPTNVTQLGGDTTALTNLKNSSLAITSGTVATDGSNSATSFKVDATLGAKATDYFGNGDGGMVLVFIDGTTNEWQGRRVTAFNATTDFITVEEAFSATPTDADTFILVGRITELS